MNNISKWNKELLYSFLFFILANALFFVAPTFIFEVLWSGTNTKTCFPFGVMSNLSLFVFFIFLIISVYMGIKSTERPPSVIRWFGHVMVVISSVYLIAIILLLLNFCDVI